jgi:predicted DNA-binding protein (MmcQ/YjbR family)
MAETFATRVDALRAALPGVVKTHPFDGQHEAWTVGGKMFACLGGAAAGVSIKTPDVETASMLIEAGVATRAPYFHANWARLPETVGDDEQRHRLAVAYDTIRTGLPRKTRDALPAR